jgi:exopolyphosphatase/guanosine-5'-triphosphate,3'-diphosphate pyrophosphatase
VRVAVVDIGTNTTRLLVADVEDDTVHELERRTKVTRLGEGVDATGRLADTAVQRVADTLATYKHVIDELRPERITALATSAVRDAANGDEFRELVQDRFGLDLRIIPGDEEARLTFAGATAARPPGGPELVVIDIGGGSTEFVAGHAGGAPELAVSTQAGSVRQTERHLHDDPPTGDQLQELRDDVRRIIDTEVPDDVRSRIADAVAVAGTATSLAAIDQRLDPYDPAKVDGYRLTAGACERILGDLASVPLAQRRDIPGLHPDRAPTIIAGTAILAESMRAFGLDSLEVSEADILHGAALDAARKG